MLKGKFNFLRRFFMFRKLSLSVFAMVTVIALLLLCCGCSGEDNKDKKENPAENSSANVDKKSDNSYKLEDTDSDGVIEEMTSEELVKKLSKLSTDTTMYDVVDIFGKYPHMDEQADSDIWRYFCDDITITLTGINLDSGLLYSAIASCGKSSLYIIPFIIENETSDKEDEIPTDSDIIEDIDSDGVIDEMTAEEFVKKISKLDNETTMKDLPKIFGKYPQEIDDVSTNSWRYFSGNLIIRLDGISSLTSDKLDKIIIEVKDSNDDCLYFDLNDTTYQSKDSIDDNEVSGKVPQIYDTEYEKIWRSGDGKVTFTNNNRLGLKGRGGYEGEFEDYLEFSEIDVAMDFYDDDNHKYDGIFTMSKYTQENGETVIDPFVSGYYILNDENEKKFTVNVIDVDNNILKSGYKKGGKIVFYQVQE